METNTTKDLGNSTGKLLQDQLTRVGLVDGLCSEIMAIMPPIVRDAHSEDLSLSSIFHDRVNHDIMCFAYARLAILASGIFRERLWRKFTDGLIEYASSHLGNPPRTRAHINQYINDYKNAVDGFCGNYPPNTRQILLKGTEQIENIVSYLVENINTKRHRMPLFSLLKFVFLLLFGLFATILIGIDLNYPTFLLTTAVLGIIGFKMGKSTRVPLNPRDIPFSRMIVLSYVEFDRWARKYNLIMKDSSFFSRTDVHWTEKLPVLFSGYDAVGHCFEPGRSTFKMLILDLSIILFIFFPIISESFRNINDTGLFFIQIMCSLALGLFGGQATGNFYRWIRSQM
jgi:hypothetical protein